jgi:3-methyladenine DNA glycosylase AlkD
VSDLADRVLAAFAPAADSAAAAPMARYMRDQFPFLGIGTQPRRALQRSVFGRRRPDHDELLATAAALWDQPEREYQYAACDLLVRNATQLSAADLTVVERLVTTKSWWDTVDVLAINVVGPVVLADRSSADPTMDEWVRSDDLWLARSAILHQNKWKADTDETRLFAMCLARADERDFFIRKAIGWALREYSRTAPDAVRAFVASNEGELSALTRREALKRLARGT